MSITHGEKAVQRPILRRTLFWGILCAGSVSLALVLAEGILRLASGFLPVEVQKIMRADPGKYGVMHPYIGHLHKPNNPLIISGRDFHAIHHTDGHGFRNTWPWPETAEIVTLGDSVTFGHGVNDDQAWPAILAQSYPAIRVVNLGLSGAGPQQYLRVYETFGVQLRPKIVLVGLFVGNDFWDAEMFDSWLKSGADISYMVWRDFGRPLSVSLDLQQPITKLGSSLLWRAKLLARKSNLVNLLLYARENVKTALPGITKVFRAPDGTRLQLSPGILANNTRYARPGYHVFEIVLDALHRIHSVANENGATALVILQRSKEEVYLPLLGEPVPDPAAPLRAALTELGISYLDLLHEFRRRASKGEVLFFETDGHPNAKGYALIAELISSHLKQDSRGYGL